MTEQELQNTLAVVVEFIQEQVTNNQLVTTRMEAIEKRLDTIEETIENWPKVLKDWTDILVAARDEEGGE